MKTQVFNYILIYFPVNTIYLLSLVNKAYRNLCIDQFPKIKSHYLEVLVDKSQQFNENLFFKFPKRKKIKYCVENFPEKRLHFLSLSLMYGMLDVASYIFNLKISIDTEIMFIPGNLACLKFCENNDLPIDNVEKIINSISLIDSFEYVEYLLKFKAYELKTPNYLWFEPKDINEMKYFDLLYDYNSNSLSLYNAFVPLKRALQNRDLIFIEYLYENYDLYYLETYHIKQIIETKHLNIIQYFVETANSNFNEYFQKDTPEYSKRLIKEINEILITSNSISCLEFLKTTFQIEISTQYLYLGKQTEILEFH